MLMTSCALTPAEYVEQVSDEAAEMEAQNKRIVECLSQRDIKGAEDALQSAREQADKSLAKLQAMTPYNGDDALRQSCIEFVDFYKTIFSNEYEQAFSVLRDPGARTPENIEKIALVSQGLDTENRFLKADLLKSIKRFCRDYGLTIDNY